VSRVSVEIQYTAVTAIEIDIEELPENGRQTELVGDLAVEKFSENFPSDQELYVADYGQIVEIPEEKAAKK
jgi:hypothetical protein